MPVIWDVVNGEAKATITVNAVNKHTIKAGDLAVAEYITGIFIA
jgi:hypothetical protein